MELIPSSDKKNTEDLAVHKIDKNRKDFEPISFFNKDKSFVYSHQKIEKLVAAVYMLTNFLTNDEPIKWSLRRLGMSLLRLNIDLKGSNHVNQKNLETDLRENVLEIVSLLEVASFAGLVSDMNVGILKKEFFILLSNIHDAISNKVNNEFTLKSPFFNEEVSELDGGRSGEVAANNEKNMSHMNNVATYKDDVKVGGSLKDKNVSDQNIQPESPTVPKGDGNVPSPRKTDTKLKDFGPVAVKKNKRQSIIINLLKRKKDIMVKDVADIVSDCSEKTLQRELLELVSQGILKKEGERRWTRYSLA